LASFYNRFHTSTTGKEVGPLLAEKYNTFKADRDDITVELFDHGSATPQQSLVVRIQGTKYPDEIVVLGSHIDSIASIFFGSYYEAPGADDNASGTASNLEIFRLLMQNNITFERTVEIYGYAAEEIGLVGSADMAKKYAQAGKNVVAMMQIDMNLFAPDKKEVLWFISNGTNDALNQHLATLATNYLAIPHRFGYLFAGTSDHASWMRHGFAASFPTENPNAYNQNIHTIHDTIANSGNFMFAEEFVKLGLAFVHHFAGGS
jgi:bacterial leucyl aminopeptidase